jgi:hypothetical protein
MAYNPITDFLGLLRPTANGMRAVQMPGLDYVVAALARANVFQLSVGQAAPTTNQALTAWFRPFSSSWVAEGTLFLWNPATVQYEVATPALWAVLFLAATQTAVVQDVAAAGPTVVLGNATVVRVLNVGAAVALTMPLASTKTTSVLISDWANSSGTAGRNITIGLSGGDVFPNGLATRVIASNGGSAFLRPVAGGYAL